MPRVTSGSSIPNAPVARRSAAVAQDRPEDVVALDRLVGRQDEHHLVVGAVDGQRGQRDRRRRVPAERLEDERRIGCLLA